MYPVCKFSSLSLSLSLSPFKAMQFLQELKGSRSRDMITSSVFDDGDDSEFLQKLDEIDAIVDDDEEEKELVVR